MLSPWARSFGEVFTSAGLRVLQEPIAHFLAAGLALAIAGHLYQSSHDVHRIVVTQAHIAELANQYALQFGVKPETATLDGLVDRDVHDEILFRQGRLAKLDVGDEIVRRRVVQKMQFLAQDLNPPAEPTPEGLRAYYQSTIDQYRTPSRTTFSHIFFSSDRGGDDAARNRALAVLATLSSQTSRAPERGDPFPDLYDFAAYEPGQVERLFGHNAFSTAVGEVQPGRWSGPFRSGYGWHLLYVDARQPPATPRFSEVEEAVRANYLSHAQEAANSAAFDKIARDYRVIRADRKLDK